MFEDVRPLSACSVLSLPPSLTGMTMRNKVNVIMGIGLLTVTERYKGWERVRYTAMQHASFMYKKRIELIEHMALQMYVLPCRVAEGQPGLPGRPASPDFPLGLAGQTLT